MAEARKNELKKVVSNDDCRRRRGETTIQLRKNQKEEGLAKRRNMMMNNFVEETPTTDPNVDSNRSTEVSTKLPTVQDIPTLMVSFNSPDPSQQVISLRAFRRLLSTERNPPVQQCIDCGAIPMFVAFLQVIYILLSHFSSSFSSSSLKKTLCYFQC